jgi:hypothetical protein
LELFVVGVVWAQGLVERVIDIAQRIADLNLLSCNILCGGRDGLGVVVKEVEFVEGKELGGLLLK